MSGTLVGISLPTFFIGILSIYVFSVLLGWLPPYGRGEVSKGGVLDDGTSILNGITHLVLPAFTLALFQLSMSTRVMRGDMMAVLLEDYVRTARAKGLSPIPGDPASCPQECTHPLCHHCRPPTGTAYRLCNRHRDRIPVAGHGETACLPPSRRTTSPSSSPTSW